MFMVLQGNDRYQDHVHKRKGPSLRSVKPLHLFLLLTVSGLVLSACRKDEQFTDASGISLELGQDTVLFDTIFTTVPFSVTKRFVVHNRNSEAVRVDINLEGGTPSPYRINVDGASGVSFDDVEIRGGDSIFVFVEASLDQNNTNNPYIIEDHILFNTNGTEQEVLLLAWGQDAHFFYPDRAIQGFPPFSIIAGLDDNGQGTCETVLWTDDKPYVIYGYAVVDSCSTLQIDPGVRVHFHGGGGLWVYRWGQIQADGTVDEPITFQGDRLEPFYAELPGQWDRIWINEGPAANENRFVNCVVKNSLIGIQCETFPLYPEEPTSATRLVLDKVKIRNCSAVGLLSRNYRIQATNLLVGDCAQYGVALTGGGEYLFDQFTLANYWDYDIRQTPAFYMTNAFRDITNTIQVRQIVNSNFLNGIIHGANANEFLYEFNDLDEPVLSFQRMMLRTDVSTTNTTFFPDQSTIYRNQGPGFVDVPGRDFHITSASYAIDRAADVGTIGTFFDLDGVQRQNPRDLGCYEYRP
jgi:hypothetical protein